ncbi:MAG: hypothetical protein ACRCZF_07560 [Gemmataceae bacterium]
MPSVWRQGEYLGTRYITGPQILTLLIALVNERVVAPGVTALDVCPLYGPTAAEVIRAAVLAGGQELSQDVSLVVRQADSNLAVGRHAGMLLSIRSIL